MKRITLILVRASNGNPLISTTTIMAFYIMFTFFEAGVETIIWGERFEHWLDPIFQLFFIGYAAYSVYFCAVHNSVSKGD